MASSLHVIDSHTALNSHHKLSSSIKDIPYRWHDCASIVQPIKYCLIIYLNIVLEWVEYNNNFIESNNSVISQAFKLKTQQSDQRKSTWKMRGLSLNHMAASNFLAFLDRIESILNNGVDRLSNPFHLYKNLTVLCEGAIKWP